MFRGSGTLIKVLAFIYGIGSAIGVIFTGAGTMTVSPTGGIVIIAIGLIGAVIVFFPLYTLGHLADEMFKVKDALKEMGWTEDGYSTRPSTYIEELEATEDAIEQVLSHSTGEVWVCPNCQTENMSSCSMCTMCGTPKL